jgi:hypothetical protein
MPAIDHLIDDLFAANERQPRDEIQRWAVAARLSTADLNTLDTLAEGEYTRDEVIDALQRAGGDPGQPETGADAADIGTEEGVPAIDLSEADLLRELASLHRTRHETLLHASSQALQHHSERTTSLELEYLRRHPERDIDPERLRAGARDRP